MARDERIAPIARDRNELHRRGRVAGAEVLLSPERWIRSFGLVLLVAGLTMNEWVIATFLTGDGEINPYVKVLYVRFANLYCVAWGGVMVARPGRVRAALSTFVLSLTLLLSVEVAAAVAYRVDNGQWHTNLQDELPMFEPHPYLVGAPIPDISRTEREVTISHNSLGMRGREDVVERAAGVIRIVTMGGSSTYNTGVNDDETWQNHLTRALGPGHEILNMGVPGYSTAEHVIQTALQLEDLDADLVIYYVGWNDVRSMHVADLESDYSSFHGRGQYWNLGLPLNVWTGPKLALPLMLVQAGQGLGWVNRFDSFRPSESGVTSSDADDRALEIYLHNVRTMIALARAQGAAPVLVPQVLNDARWTGDEPMWWIPHVPQRDVPALMAVYNDALRQVALENSVPFAGAVIAVDWSEDDFLDEGHFSPQGQVRFANALASDLRQFLTR